MRPASVSIQCESKPGKRSVIASGCGTPRRHEVRLGEILALEEERSVKRLRQGVNETIAEIQTCRVAAFAESEQCIYRQSLLFPLHRFGSQAELLDEPVDLV